MEKNENIILKLGNMIATTIADDKSAPLHLRCMSNNIVAQKKMRELNNKLFVSKTTLTDAQMEEYISICKYMTQRFGDILKGCR